MESEEYTFDDEEFFSYESDNSEIEAEDFEEFETVNSQKLPEKQDSRTIYEVMTPEECFKTVTLIIKDLKSVLGPEHPSLRVSVRLRCQILACSRQQRRWGTGL